MNKKHNTKENSLNLLFSRTPPETIIEVISTKGEEVYKKVMKFEDAVRMEKREGWNYTIYQLGFSQFKITKTL